MKNFEPQLSLIVWLYVIAIRWFAIYLANTKHTATCVYIYIHMYDDNTMIKKTVYKFKKT